MILVERRLDLFGKQRAGTVFHPRAPFLQHHVAFRPDHFVSQYEPAHAVGLEFHHLRQRIRANLLVVGGVVARGEGVLIAADSGNGGGEVAGSMFFRTLEHQVFEKMRNAGAARLLIGAANLVPDHMGDHGCAAIRNNDDLKSVLQREARRAIVRAGRCCEERKHHQRERKVWAPRSVRLKRHSGIPGGLIET